MPRDGDGGVDRAADLSRIERATSTPAHSSGISATAVYGSGDLAASRPVSISTADRRERAAPGGRTRDVRGEAKGGSWHGTVDRAGAVSDILSHRD